MRVPFQKSNEQHFSVTCKSSIGGATRGCAIKKNQKKPQCSFVQVTFPLGTRSGATAAISMTGGCKCCRQTRYETYHLIIFTKSWLARSCSLAWAADPDMSKVCSEQTRQQFSDALMTKIRLWGDDIQKNRQMLNYLGRKNIFLEECTHNQSTAASARAQSKKETLRDCEVTVFSDLPWHPGDETAKKLLSQSLSETAAGQRSLVDDHGAVEQVRAGRHRKSWK